MRALEPPSFPLRLVSQILGERNQPVCHAEPAGAAWLLDKLLNLTYARPRSFATVASLFITVSMYFLILSNLKPVPNWTVPGHPEPITLSSGEFSVLNQLQLGRDSGLYTLPRVLKTTGLEQSLRDAPDRAIVVVTLIHPDGRASMLEILTPRNRPDVAEQVTDAVRDISFRPAMASGRPVATQLVLMLEKIEVRR